MMRVPHFGPYAMTLLTLSIAGVSGTTQDAVTLDQAVKDYADTLAAVIDTVHRSHIKFERQHVLVAWAVRGLYDAALEPVPDELVARLAPRELLDRAPLTHFLAGVRRPLGLRAGLASPKDIEASAVAIFRAREPDRQESRLLPSNPAMAIDSHRRWAIIGLEVEKDPETGVLRVRTPVLDGPAYWAGLRAGDRIPLLIAHKFHSPDRWLPLGTVTASLADCEEHLGGRPGSRVLLVYWRDKLFDLRCVTVQRQAVSSETVFGVRRDDTDHWDFLLDGDRKIAYIRVQRFGSGTADELKRAIQSCQYRGARALILDLRFCPRSLVSEARKTAELLAGPRRLFSARARFMGADWDGKQPALWTNGPVACLVNERTAGVSELVAAALQDYGLAFIVGVRTAGHVEIDNMVPILSGRWQLNLTTAVMESAGRRNLSRLLGSGKPGDIWGVRPDRGCEVPFAPGEVEALAKHFARLECIDPPGQPKYDLTKFHDRQLDRAWEVLRARLAAAK